jgi:hypothetical protein
MLRYPTPLQSGPVYTAGGMRPSVKVCIVVLTASEIESEFLDLDCSVEIEIILSSDSARTSVSL